MSYVYFRVIYLVTRTPVCVYRRFHSTETAMLKVLADAYVAADTGHVTLLSLLDLSAAFDTKQ